MRQQSAVLHAQAIITTFLLAIGTGLHVGGTTAAVAIHGWPSTIVSHSVTLFAVGQILSLTAMQANPVCFLRPWVIKAAIGALLLSSVGLMQFTSTTLTWLMFAFLRGLTAAILTNYIQYLLAQYSYRTEHGRAFGWRYAALCGGAIVSPLLLAVGLSLSVVARILVGAYMITALLLIFMPRANQNRPSRPALHPPWTRLTQTPLLWMCSFLAGALGEAPFYLVFEFGSISGLPVPAAQWLLTAMLLGGFLLQPFLARLIDSKKYATLGFFTIPLFSVTLSGILTVVSLTTDAPPTGSVLLIVFALGTVIASCATFGAVLISRIYPENERSQAIALNVLLYFLGQAGGTWLLTIGIYIIGAAGYGIGVGILGFLMTAVMMGLRSRLRID